jgi:ligand-binding sensor domain-containing protein
LLLPLRWGAFLFLLCGPGSLLALNPAKTLDQFVHQSWTSQEGLPSNDVMVTLQTEDGYLWIGGDGGLARFDGARFDVFDKASGNLPGELVYCLAEGADHSVWIGTNGGLVRYQAGNFQLIGKNTELDGARITAVARAGNDIWISGEMGLYRFGHGALELIKSPDPNRPVAHEYILVDRSGSVWIIQRNGSAYQFRGNRLEVDQGLSPLLGKYLMGAAFDRQGTLWIATLDTLYS